MKKINFRIFITVLTMFAAFLLVNCSSDTTTKTTTNTANANAANVKPANMTPVNTAPANTEQKNANAAAPANETKETADSVGVAECDEYIKKYEACLTKVAKAAPQVQPAMNSAFEQQRSAFKTAASTPQGKATLGSTCKQAIETAKKATSSYACEW